jgi:hypothetical protein
MRGRLFNLAEDFTGRRWNGHGADPEFTEIPMPAGTVVKCVMVSRLGDCGVTTDLDAESGYILRVPPAALEVV